MTTETLATYLAAAKAAKERALSIPSFAMLSYMARESIADIPALADAVAALVAEVERLTEAIKTHRSQKADDRCIEDDDRLYEALGDGIKCDRRVGSKSAMLTNCQRFIQNRCEGGGWPSYAELEAKVQGEYARGRAEERAAVVAWLGRVDYWVLRNAIERGEHLEVKDVLE